MLPKPLEIIKKTTEYASKILLYAKPKQGKSTILSELSKQYKCLIIDTEDSHRMLDSCKVLIDQSLSPKDKWDSLNTTLNEIYKSGYKDGKYTPPYHILVIDTLSEIDAWSEAAGTYSYMKKPQGKAHNKVKDTAGRPTTKELVFNSDEWESVHTLANGSGYQFSRQEMLNLIDKINVLAPIVIYVCHVKDKLMANTLGEEVSTREINLTGKLKDIVAQHKVDTIAYAYRDDDKLMFSFTDESSGSRVPELSGKQICISEKLKTGNIKTNWDLIIDPQYKN